MRTVVNHRGKFYVLSEDKKAMNAITRDGLSRFPEPANDYKEVYLDNFHERWVNALIKFHKGNSPEKLSPTLITVGEVRQQYEAHIKGGGTVRNFRVRTNLK